MTADVASCRHIQERVAPILQSIRDHPSTRSIRIGSKVAIPFVFYILLPRLRSLLLFLFTEILLYDDHPPTVRSPAPLVGWVSKLLFAAILLIRGLDSSRGGGLVESVLCLIIDGLSWVWVASDARIRRFGATIPFDTVARDSITQTANRSVPVSSGDVYGCIQSHLYYIRQYAIGLVSWTVMYVLRSGLPLGILWWSIAVGYIPRFWIVFLLMQGACAMTAYGDAVSTEETDTANRCWDDTLRVYAARLTTIPAPHTPHTPHTPEERPVPVNPQWAYPPKIDQEQTMKMLDTILSSALNDVLVKTKAA